MRGAGDPVLRVPILCTGNSARSQMAEGIFRSLSQGRWVVESAGTTRRVSTLSQ
ncbi:MAG: hypothetical protein HYS33_08845 [Acidobacteria bacterium]|nr:hypothetical protein [Acidobacteriota bacterium]